MPNTIRDEVLSLPPGERNRRAAQRMAEQAMPHLPLTWTVGQGRERTLIQVTRVGWEDNRLLLQVAARRGEWEYEDDVRIVNPRFMVATGRMIPNPEPGPDAAETVHEVEENPVEAIKLAVGDAVRLWQGGRR